MKFFKFLIIFILLVPSVFAIGVAPSSYETQFEDNKVETFNFVFFTHGNATKINLTADGPLSQYVSLTHNIFDLENKGRQQITATINYPKYKELDVFGRVRLNIRAEELAQNPEGGFSALTAVVGLIKISIPLPGQFGEISKFDIPSIEEGKNTKINLNLLNRGTEPLLNKKASVKIFSPENKLIETINFNNINILPQKELELTKDLISKNYIPGKYSAIAEFQFSQEADPSTKENTFFIGTTDILLTNHSKTLIKGKITPIQLEFQSLWGSPLKDIRSTLEFNGEIQNLVSMDFEPFAQKKITAYLDVPRSEDETTKAKLNLKIPQKDGSTKDKELTLNFNLEETPSSFGDIFKNNTTLLLTILILLLVSINIFLILKPKKNAKKKKK